MGDALFGTRLSEASEPELRGGELFVVDNSISGWTGLRYLQQWAELATSFDIATGYFEIGSLLELDGHWQKLDKIRILMGDEMTQRTRRALLEAIKSRAEKVLDESLEADKEANPFLDGVLGIVEAMKSGQIECRVYNKDKFHAKAYITHAKLDVVGAQALVGSSNFTRPGLTENVELNIQVQSGREVAQLQEWYEYHWNEAEDITEDLIKLVERHTREYSPFDVYTKALHEFFKGHEITASEWEERSDLFKALDRYQKEAYWALMKIARQHRGAFLCDGVGLGKTFVGLMLIERLVLYEGKRVVLFAPKGAKEGVWEPHLNEWLPHIGGIGGGVDFSSLSVFSHTDLNRSGDFPERFRRMTELADVVIIDEAHHFRNVGNTGESESGKSRSGYYKMFDLMDDAVRPKTLFMLTATPVNNRLTDFRHMAELFTRGQDNYFARTLGVNSFRGHFSQMERELRSSFENQDIDIGENLEEANQLLSRDTTFSSLVVQRSRAYAKASQEREKGESTSFPERQPPIVADYSIRKSFGTLLGIVEKAFSKDQPLFSLPMYYPLAYYKGPDDTIDPLEEGRQKQVVGLIRTMFLKRFESSVASFELSSDRLMKRLLLFMEVHSETDAEKRVLERWRLQNAGIIQYSTEQQLHFWDGVDEDELEDDVFSPEELDDATKLDRDEYKVEEMLAETMLDLNQVVEFLTETRRFKPGNDDKLNKLKRVLNSKDLKDQKVLIFTEYADTARYLHRQLVEAGFTGVAEVDSGTGGKRADVIQRFSPYYNKSTSAKLAANGKDEIRVLISTDVLSEGLNLQDASRMINYDIHWNPVRLMQRIGRVDRRTDPRIEEKLLEDHPEVVASRGKVYFWNFLPPDELNSLLTLYKRVTHKTLMISKTLGIEGKQLLTPDDDYDPLREFNHAYEGTKTAIEDMHLDYQDLLATYPELKVSLDRMPGSVFSGREKPKDGVRGVFFCYALPALDQEEGEFTEEAGTTRWYLYDIDKDAIVEEPSEIIASIRSERDTPRLCVDEKATLLDIRSKVTNHIKNGYLKRIDAPVGVKPSLKCWMEINEGVNA